MNRRWYPFDHPEWGIKIRMMAAAAGLVPIQDFGAHSDVGVIRVDDMCYLRFADGSVSVPLEFAKFADVQDASLKELYLAGVLTQAHLEEVEAEENAIYQEQQIRRQEDDRQRLVHKAERTLTNPLNEEQHILAQDVQYRFRDLSEEDLLIIHRRLREITAEIERIKALTPEELLTAEELERYNAIGAPASG